MCRVSLGASCAVLSRRLITMVREGGRLLVCPLVLVCSHENLLHYTQPKVWGLGGVMLDINTQRVDREEQCMCRTGRSQLLSLYVHRVS